VTVKPFFAALVLLGGIAVAQEKQLCFTIDDLPLVTYGINDTTYKRAVSEKLIHALVSNGIPAIGFVNESKLYPGYGLNAFEVSLLEHWVDAGLDLGNHTFSHPDFNKVNCVEFFEDVIKGETISRALLEKAGKKLQYFRHPFLHTGATEAKADSLSWFLARRGYTVAPVTIDDDDYLFAVAYHRARASEDTALAEKIGHDYVAYMQEKLRYFDHESELLFDRPIRQILLIHASRLNADYVDSLALMCVNNGYRFVDLATALSDEVYRKPIGAHGDMGISWLDRWALDEGRPKSFFKDEPEVPGYIAQMAK
jgi:peptidoglycan/xylan/chitin deacetylase (PgdA/CDA1 family)